jgi:Protein of unknown function (DUF1449).
MIWLASALLGFGAGGLVVQTLADGTLGSPLPVWLAAVPALLSGWGVARGFGGLFARLIPQDETQSVSEAHLGRRQGVITQGTAARGRPAEVRVTDRHGNPHYLRAEPLQDQAQIPRAARFWCCATIGRASTGCCRSTKSLFFHGRFSWLLLP